MQTAAFYFGKCFPTFIAMLSIFLTGMLFLFITASIGYFFNRIARGNERVSAGFFKAVLTGTLVLTVYLNICSIFIKTDYWLLALPFGLSLFVLSKPYVRLQLRQMFKQNSKLLFSKSNVAVTLAFLLVLALFTIVPPYNTDSSGYHFLAILWNEKFSAVPGLANLFPQYGYNSSFFVLSAAFSFTTIFYQSIYPINAVLTVMFFLWILKKSYKYSDARKYLLWMMLLVFLRQFPINLASPSADSLASILVFYVLFSVFEMDMEKAGQKDWKYLLVLAVFAIIIKLSTLPLIIVGLLPFICRRQNFRKNCLDYLRLMPLLSLIIVPWIVRNLILSGYLIFPFPAVDLFSFEWKVPLDVAWREQIHISQGAKMAGEDWLAVSKMPITQWFPKWLPNVWNDNHFNFLLVVAGLLSPLMLAVVFFFRKNMQPGVLFSIFMACSGVWFWVLTSPDIRFGYHYLVPCIVFPSMVILQSGREAGNALVFQTIFVMLTVAGCVYYAGIAIRFLQPYTIAACVMRPFKCPEYDKNNALNSFRFVLLNKSIRLYIHDSLHHSINAPLPSCAPYRSGISLRGSKLQDGFKTQP